MATGSRFQSKLPMWVQESLTGAIRSAVSLPLLMGFEPAMATARAAGRLFATSRINRKRFPRSATNLRIAFPWASEERIHELAVSGYEHLFQLGVEISYTPRLITEEGFRRQLSFSPIEPAVRALLSGRPIILLSGHSGNWELIGYSMSMLGFPMAATYRPLDLRPLDAWLFDTRQRRGLTLHSKFGSVRSIPIAMAEGMPAGFVADQSGGDRGVFVPFFGRLTSTYKSIGLLAKQSGATIICGNARRLSPQDSVPGGGVAGNAGTGGPPSMRYTVQLVDVFGPDDWNGRPDPLYYLTARYRRAIERMILQAPDQYLWMHRVWRSRPLHERSGKPFPDALRSKLAGLPWMTDSDLEGIVDRSDRDTRLVAEGAPL